MNDLFLRVAQEFDPVSQIDQPGSVDAGDSSPPPDSNAADAGDREEIVEELRDDVSETGARDDSQLFEERLERVRDYEVDALQRADPLEAVMASANADLLKLHAHYFQTVYAGLAAESYCARSVRRIPEAPQTADESDEPVPPARAAGTESPSALPRVIRCEVTDSRPGRVKDRCSGRTMYWQNSEHRPAQSENSQS